MIHKPGLKQITFTRLGQNSFFAYPVFCLNISWNMHTNLVFMCIVFHHRRGDHTTVWGPTLGEFWVHIAYYHWWYVASYGNMYQYTQLCLVYVNASYLFYHNPLFKWISIKGSWKIINDKTLISLLLLGYFYRSNAEKQDTIAILGLCSSVLVLTVAIDT